MLFGGRKMKHKKQKKTKKAGRILLAVFAVLIGTLGVLLFTSERWMRKTWPNLSMEELVYQLKAPIAGTSHDLLMSYVCSSALIAAAAGEKQKFHHHGHVPDHACQPRCHHRG